MKFLIDTNIVIFTLVNGITTDLILQKLAGNNVLALPFGPREVRMITHLDFTDEMLDKTINVLKSLNI